MKNRNKYRIIKDIQGIKVQEKVMNYYSSGPATYWENVETDKRVIVRPKTYRKNFWGTEVVDDNGHYYYEDKIFKTYDDACKYIKSVSYEIIEHDCK